MKISDLIKQGGKKLYSEDECAPDAERIDEAWQRLFGEPRPKAADSLAYEDGGDTFYYLYPHGRIAQIGPPRGGWTEIWVIEESLAAQAG